MSKQFQNFFSQRFQSTENVAVDQVRWVPDSENASGQALGQGKRFSELNQPHGELAPASVDERLGKHSPLNTDRRNSKKDSRSPMISKENAGEPNDDKKNERPQHFKNALDPTFFMKCPQCCQAKLRVRLARTNQNLFVACSGYPQCQNTMNMPKAITNITMLDENCPKCLKRDKKEVKLFTIEFNSILVNEVMAQVLPKEDNTAGTFCIFVGCDSGYTTLCDETRKLPNQKTFGSEALPTTNPNGIPPYYYQKPEVDCVANGGGPVKKPKKDPASSRTKSPNSKTKGEGIGR